MTLQEQWFKSAYEDGKIKKRTWDEYLPMEQKIYEILLENKTTHIEGSIDEFSETYNVNDEYVIGFLDGINEALDQPIDLESITDDTHIVLDWNFEKLYKKMVEYRAEHLVKLPQWNNIFDEVTLQRMYKDQRNSTTIRKQRKIGRNDPCPCGSGKKYKKCCGMLKNAQ
ncbi:MAG: SEC-C domain-containing protein [Clostridiales bacterium]|nr:SEC-C domain-containing protein [Clostridiales bacterium]